MSYLQPLATGRGQRADRLGQFVLQWPQYQGERGAELMADVRKKRGLRAVNLR